MIACIIRINQTRPSPQRSVRRIKTKQTDVKDRYVSSLRLSFQLKSIAVYVAPLLLESKYCCHGN